MLHVRELERTPRPHTTLVNALTKKEKSSTGYGLTDRKETVDPVLDALSTEAPPGGLLSTLRNANAVGFRY